MAMGIKEKDLEASYGSLPGDTRSRRSEVACRVASRPWAEAAKTAPLMLSLATSVIHVPTVRFFHDANIPSMGENGFVGKFSDSCSENTRILMTFPKDDPILFAGQLLGPCL